MMNFNYTGNGILAFTHQEKDYIINEHGPHSLPEDSELIKSLVAQKLLIEVQETELKTKKNKLIIKTID